MLFLIVKPAFGLAEFLRREYNNFSQIVISLWIHSVNVFKSYGLFHLLLKFCGALIEK